MALDSLTRGKYDFGAIMNEPNINRAFYLPRLPREYYQGDAVVHWTLPISMAQLCLIIRRCIRCKEISGRSSGGFTYRRSIQTLGKLFDLLSGSSRCKE